MQSSVDNTHVNTFCHLPAFHQVHKRATVDLVSVLQSLQPTSSIVPARFSADATLLAEGLHQGKHLTIWC